MNYKSWISSSGELDYFTEESALEILGLGLFPPSFLFFGDA